ncbi:methyltransferase family protein [Nocardia sp. NPDC052566]|uniref:methyltransferase family protein n=1 Tax=Nocardia sp. NPDC052566 TaxID=3364330 RepID=UPI0037C90E66
MAVATLVLFSVFLLLVVGVRVWVQVRHNSDTDFRRLAGPRGAVQWRIGWLATAGSLVLGVVSPVAVLMGLEPLVDNISVAAIAVGLTVTGMVATVVAQLMMGESWRPNVDPEERTALVTSGPFRLVRNPVLASVLVTCAGLSLMTPTVIGFAGLAAAVVANELLVRLVEEPYLRRVHGDEYRRYARAVGRFVPGIGRIR